MNDIMKIISMWCYTFNYIEYLQFSKSSLYVITKYVFLSLYSFIIDKLKGLHCFISNCAYIIQNSCYRDIL